MAGPKRRALAGGDAMNIVKSLLACARNSQPAMSAVDINRCVELVLKEFRTHLFKKNITIEKHLQKNIPENGSMDIKTQSRISIKLRENIIRFI